MFRLGKPLVHFPNSRMITFRLRMPPSVCMTTSNPSSGRRPYHGSCHCGHTKYVAFLTFPPTMSPTAPPSSTIRIYKCNCSVCQKMGFFHLRLKSSPDDFILLSPLDHEAGGLGDYKCNAGQTHRYFCKTCGVRCFAFRGTGEVVEVGEDSWSNEGGEGGKTTRVWRPRKEGWNEGECSYLSLNALTLESGQEGLDLREWPEKNWIWYLDKKNDKDNLRIGEPYEGGHY